MSQTTYDALKVFESGEFLRAVALLNKNGVTLDCSNGLRFFYYHSDEHRDLPLPASDLSLYLKDPLQYKANKHGVTPEHFKQWEEALEFNSATGGVPCSAMTQSGHPCKKVAYSKKYRVPKDPKKFDATAVAFCPTHDNNTMNVRTLKP